MSPSARQASARHESNSSRAPDRRRPAGLLFLLLVITLPALGAVAIWRQIRPLVVVQEQYLVGPEQIEVTERPKWIRADVRAEVLRDASLDERLSILEEAIAPQLASAFEFHPWIKEVRQISRHPGPRVHVDLVYRRPVLMIEISGPKGLSLTPVDRDGVRLPNEDFTLFEKQRYPRLVGISRQPLVGQPWDDSLVLGAARIAELVEPYWHDWKLRYLAASDSGRSDASMDATTDRSSDQATYQLVGPNGMRVQWGHAPGAEQTGEPAAEVKCRRIAQVLEARNSDDSPQSSLIDVRRIR